MKKILCIISVLLCILLTACGDATSIGIIGGADGPTVIKNYRINNDAILLNAIKKL